MSDVLNHLAAVLVEQAQAFADQDGTAIRPVHIFGASNELISAIGRLRDQMLAPASSALVVGSVYQTGVPAFPRGTLVEVLGDFAVLVDSDDMHSAFPVASLKSVVQASEAQPQLDLEQKPATLTEGSASPGGSESSVTPPATESAASVAPEAPAAVNPEPSSSAAP